MLRPSFVPPPEIRALRQYTPPAAAPDAGPYPVLAAAGEDAGGRPVQADVADLKAGRAGISPGDDRRRARPRGAGGPGPGQSAGPDGTTGPGAGSRADAAVLSAVARLDEIPGISPLAAIALIAEFGRDMSRFLTPEALVSWAGPARGAGRRARATATPVACARWAADGAAGTATFLGERHRRMSSRPGGGGRRKADVAVGRSILVIVWDLLKNPTRRGAILLCTERSSR